MTARIIVEASIKLFVRMGYHGTTISDIACVSKFTKGAIYHHFESKDSILRAILRENEERFLDRAIVKCSL